MKIFLVTLSLILLSGCVGPLKELKYQVEDSWDSNIMDGDPTALTDVVNQKK